MNNNQKGNLNPNWKGGKRKQGKGYILVKCETHPNCDKIGYVLEHRLVMEKHLGRTLLKTEVVHHINGIRDDNRIENLMVFNNKSEHQRHHTKRRKSLKGGMD